MAITKRWSCCRRATSKGSGCRTRSIIGTCGRSICSVEVVRNAPNVIATGVSNDAPTSKREKNTSKRSIRFCKAWGSRFPTRSKVVATSNWHGGHMPQAAPNTEKLDEHLQEVVRALHGAVKQGVSHANDSKVVDNAIEDCKEI